MSWPLILAWLIVAPSAQSSVLPHVAVGHAVPDLLLLLALSVGFTVKKPDVFAAAWLIGLVRDVYSQHPLGLHALAYVMVSVVVCRLRAEFFCDHMATRMVVTAIASVAVGGLAWGLTAAAHPRLSPAAALGCVAASMFYTTLVCPLAYALFDGAARLTRWRRR